MTIRLLAQYGNYPPNSLVTLDAATETGLVADKTATTNLTGGSVYVPNTGSLNTLPFGGGGGGGATTFAALTDKATVDLPSTNVPLATALYGIAADMIIVKRSRKFAPDPTGVQAIDFTNYRNFFTTLGPNQHVVYPRADVTLPPGWHRVWDRQAEEGNHVNLILANDSVKTTTGPIAPGANSIPLNNTTGLVVGQYVTFFGDVVSDNSPGRYNLFVEITGITPGVSVAVSTVDGALCVKLDQTTGQTFKSGATLVTGGDFWGSMLQHTAAYNASGNAFAYWSTMPSNVRVEGLNFDGNRANQTYSRWEWQVMLHALGNDWLVNGITGKNIRGEFCVAGGLSHGFNDWDIQGIDGNLLHIGAMFNGQKTVTSGTLAPGATSFTVASVAGIRKYSKFTVTGTNAASGACYHPNFIRVTDINAGTNTIYCEPLPAFRRTSDNDTNSGNGHALTSATVNFLFGTDKVRLDGVVGKKGNQDLTVGHGDGFITNSNGGYGLTAENCEFEDGEAAAFGSWDYSGDDGLVVTHTTITGCKGGAFTCKSAASTGEEREGVSLSQVTVTNCGQSTIGGDMSAATLTSTVRKVNVSKCTFTDAPFAIHGMTGGVIDGIEIFITPEHALGGKGGVIGAGAAIDFVSCVAGKVGNINVYGVDFGANGGPLPILDGSNNPINNFGFRSEASSATASLALSKQGKMQFHHIHTEGFVVGSRIVNWASSGFDADIITGKNAALRTVHLVGIAGGKTSTFGGCHGVLDSATNQTQAGVNVPGGRQAFKVENADPSDNLISRGGNIGELPVYVSVHGYLTPFAVGDHVVLENDTALNTGAGTRLFEFAGGVTSITMNNCRRNQDFDNGGNAYPAALRGNGSRNYKIARSINLVQATGSTAAIKSSHERVNLNHASTLADLALGFDPAARYPNGRVTAVYFKSAVTNLTASSTGATFSGLPTFATAGQTLNFAYDAPNTTFIVA